MQMLMSYMSTPINACQHLSTPFVISYTRSEFRSSELGPRRFAPQLHDRGIRLQSGSVAFQMLLVCQHLSTPIVDQRMSTPINADQRMSTHVNTYQLPL